jgi:hypothetical protein
MPTTIRPLNKLVWAFGLGLSALAACGQESSPAQQQPLIAALDGPLDACQERFETCRLSPSADPAACQASMRACLEGVATWMEQSRALIEMCRVEAGECLVSQPGPQGAFTCQQQYQSCVAPAFQPGSSDEDAGVADQDDAGATTGAAGGSPDPGTAGSGGGRFPRRLPPRVPTQPTAPTPADACRDELLACLSPSADLVQCATRARECLQASLLPSL